MLCCLPVLCAAQQSLDALIDRDIAALVATYKALHAAPELSHYEEKTAALVAKELRALGYTVTERVGKYGRPEWHGYGVVGVMKNGAGPTVLVRSDMDALPVEEKTGLPYASKVRTKNDAGQDVGVMHACGHDIHMTSLLGTARLLAELKNQWQGTLILVGQPAEETIDGARAMLDDGFYKAIPRPDFALALHDSGDQEAGTIGVTPGFALSNATSVEITVRGVGGHGSRPESSKDPIVLASQIILALQTIVSREVAPIDPAVVTVGSIHGGTRANIIPEEVKLQLTVRSYKEEVRQKILASIERIAKNTALSAGVPAELTPIVKVSETEVTPATYNDPALTERLTAVFTKLVGPNRVIKVAPIMASEDFGRFALGNQFPAVMFWLGAADPAVLAESARVGKPVPSLHSPLFAPVPEPTIRTGVKAMTAAVLELMKK
ncbi:MAG TPA: amidohydrolase [Pyrinomonadaceae bacterium]|nr:amidohydrolase [Pyrinomonadaceae bacterium]